MTPMLVLVSLLALGLAVLLARETRLRRAFQSLVARLLATLKASPRKPGDFTSHSRRHS